MARRVEELTAEKTNMEKILAEHQEEMVEMRKVLEGLCRSQLELQNKAPNSSSPPSLDSKEEGEEDEEDGDEHMNQGESFRVNPTEEEMMGGIEGLKLDSSKVKTPLAEAKATKERKSVLARLGTKHGVNEFGLIGSSISRMDDSSDSSDTSDSDSASDSDSSNSSDDSKKKSKKKKKSKSRKKRKGRMVLFREPLARKRALATAMARGDNFEQALMIQKGLVANYSPTGAHFLSELFKLRQQATLCKAFTDRLKKGVMTTQMAWSCHQHVKKLTDDLYTHYCMMDMYYGEFSESFIKLQQFIVEVYNRKTRIELTSTCEKIAKKINAMHDAKSKARAVVATPNLKVIAKQRGKVAPGHKSKSTINLSSVQCKACNRFGHMQYMRACPLHKEHDPNWTGKKKKKK